MSLGLLAKKPRFFFKKLGFFTTQKKEGNGFSRYIYPHSHLHPLASNASAPYILFQKRICYNYQKPFKIRVLYNPIKP